MTYCKSNQLLLHTNFFREICRLQTVNIINKSTTLYADKCFGGRELVFLILLFGHHYSTGLSIQQKCMVSQ